MIDVEIIIVAQKIATNFLFHLEMDEFSQISHEIQQYLQLNDLPFYYRYG